MASEHQQLIDGIMGAGTGGQRTAPYSLDECEHLNVDTTYEDEELWQGMCYDCGAELEEIEE